jgi:hypothetical protein
MACAYRDIPHYNAIQKLLTFDKLSYLMNIPHHDENGQSQLEFITSECEILEAEIETAFPNYLTLPFTVAMSEKTGRRPEFTQQVEPAFAAPHAGGKGGKGKNKGKGKGGKKQPRESNSNHDQRGNKKSKVDDSLKQAQQMSARETRRNEYNTVLGTFIKQCSIVKGEQLDIDAVDTVMKKFIRSTIKQYQLQQDLFVGEGNVKDDTFLTSPFKFKYDSKWESKGRYVIHFGAFLAIHFILTGNSAMFGEDTPNAGVVHEQLKDCRGLFSNVPCLKEICVDVFSTSSK